MLFNFLRKKQHFINVNFDKIYCISYVYNIENQNMISKLMKYLGLDFEFIYGTNYSNLEILKHNEFNFLTNTNEENYLKNNNFKLYTDLIGLSFNHYTAVMHAYESGANSVLLMDDNLAFINDVDYIEYALNNYPKDADIVKFGYISRNSLEKFNIKNKENKKCQYILSPYPIIPFIGTQLYGIFNRETMKKYLDYQLNNFTDVNSVFGKLKNIKIYGLTYPLCIDSTYIQDDIKCGYKNNYHLLDKI